MNVATFPEMYERCLVGPLFRPWAELLVGRVRIVPGERVMDVACGTGIVSRIVRERMGDRVRVVGVDRDAQMLAVARAASPDLDWRAGTADSLPARPREQFDVVLCHQGLQFFPDGVAALTEMKRVLLPGGRLGVATWRADEAPFLQALHAIAESRIGPVVDRRHLLGDEAQLQRLIEEAGFTGVSVEAVVRTVRLADAALFLRLNTMALVGMSTTASRMSEEGRARFVEAIIEDSAEILAAHTHKHGLVFEIGANLLVARS